jgi:hypothetical protein
MSMADTAYILQANLRLCAHLLTTTTNFLF